MNGCIANTSLMGMPNPVAKPEVTTTSIAKKHPAAMQPRSSSTNATKPSRSDVKFPSLVGGNGSAKKRLTTDTRLDYFETVTKNCYTYYLGLGNNEQLVRRVMKCRPWWIETKENSSMFVNFKWQQTQRGYKYDRLIDNESYKEVVNHFENNNCLTNKQELFRNLESYCSKNRIELSRLIPPTFVFNANDDCSGTAVNLFVEFYYEHWSESDNRPEEQSRKTISDMKRRLRQYFSSVNDKRVLQKPTMPDIFVSRRSNSSYLWILKPTFLNRGRGIQVFSDLQTLQKIISENISGYEEKSLASTETAKNEAANSTLKSLDNKPEPSINKTVSEVTSSNRLRASERPKSIAKPSQPTTQRGSLNIAKRQSQLQAPTDKVDPNSYMRSANSRPCVIRTNAFVVQKYLENPFLIDGRKFDIRVWVLLTHDMACYFFKEGYIRLSSEVYKQDASNISNPFMHLTNNAVQKYSSSYNSYCEGNQLSFDWFRKHLKTKDCGFSFDQALRKIKESVTITMQAAQSKMDPFSRKYCFEIFGYDFILDSNLKPWLIEVNNNPCIEESSPLLASLLPRMLDEAFRMTIDRLFTNPVREDSTKQTPFKVPGYANGQSMWEHLYKMPELKKQKRTLYS